MNSLIFFLNPITYPICQHILLAFLQNYSESDHFPHFYCYHRDLAIIISCLDECRQVPMTPLLPLTLPHLHPHTEFILPTGASAILWKHMSDQIFFLLKLPNYPPIQTESGSSYTYLQSPTSPDSSLYSHLLFLFPFALFWPCWPCCSLNMGNMCLSQGFCSYSSLYLEQS